MKRSPSPRAKTLANALDPVAPAPPAPGEFITPERMVMSIRMRFNAIRRITPELLATQLDQLQRGYLSPIMRTWEAMERRDYRISAVAPKAKSAVARHGFEILTHDDSPAALEHKAALEYFYNNLTVTDAYDENRVGGFSMLVRNMADAIGFKYSTHETLWKPSYSGLTAEFRKAPAWFFENITGRLRFLREDYAYYGVDMEPDRWLTHVDDGIDEAGSVAYMFKHLPLRDWLNFSEKFGIPGVLGRTQASIGTPQWNAMVDAVGKFANDFAAVCNIGDAIELIRAEGGTSTLPFQPIVEAMDRALSILWRGADLGTEAHRGGGEGQGASLQQSETDDIDADRAERINETLKIAIDRRVIAWTFGSAVPPLAFVKLKTRPQRNVDLDLKTIQVLAPMGVPFEINNVLERLGWERPKEGADLIRALAAKPPGATPEDDDEQIAENERRLVNKFLARSRDLFGEGLAEDLAPLQRALSRVLKGDDATLMERARILYNHLPKLGGVIITAKKSSDQLETILGTALAVGLAGKPEEA